MKKALITGVTGFVGSFLAEHLSTLNDYEISGTYVTESGIDNISSIKDKVKLHKLDLTDSDATARLISEEKPDLIFHLAALSSAGDSFKNPAEYINNNIDAQVNILEGVRGASLSPRILIVSSAEVYGHIEPGDLPIDEETPLRPVNPYAVSKVAQDFLGLQYNLAYKLPVVRVRPFNHIGPRQAPAFVVSSFAKKIADIEKGKMEPVLKVGNLGAKRDFTDVKDMVEAYTLLLEKGELGEVYNLGSGKSYEIKYILDSLLSMAKTKITVEVDKELLRPIDVPELVCDNSKAKKVIDWEPKIPILDTLKDVLEYWRKED